MIFYIDDERVKTVPAQNCYDDWPYNTNEFCTSAALAQHVSLMYRFYNHFNNLRLINSQNQPVIVCLKHVFIAVVSSEIMKCRLLK